MRLDPSARFFKPQGVPLRELTIVTLKHEELEALSLADVQHLEHAAAAASMNVSRPTFSRILAQARQTVATALVSGAALRIGGGDFRHVAEPPANATPTDGATDNDDRNTP